MITYTWRPKSGALTEWHCDTYTHTHTLINTHPHADGYYVLALISIPFASFIVYSFGKTWVDGIVLFAFFIRTISINDGTFASRHTESRNNCISAFHFRWIPLVSSNISNNILQFAHDNVFIKLNFSTKIPSSKHPFSFITLWHDC